MFSVTVLFCPHAFVLIRNIAHPSDYYCLSQTSVSLRCHWDILSGSSGLSSRLHLHFSKPFFCFVFFLQSPPKTIPPFFNGHSNLNNLEWDWVYLHFPLRLTLALRHINVYIKLPQLYDFSVTSFLLFSRLKTFCFYKGNSLEDTRNQSLYKAWENPRSHRNTTWKTSRLSC